MSKVTVMAAVNQKGGTDKTAVVSAEYTGEIQETEPAEPTKNDNTEL